VVRSCTQSAPHMEAPSTLLESRGAERLVTSLGWREAGENEATLMVL
jgi:hypothetical protein